MHYNLGMHARPTLGGWLRPLIGATFLTTYASVTIYAFGFSHGLMGRWIALAIGLAVGSAWAVLHSVLLGVLDIALLSLRRRQLPVGWPAWANAAGSAFAVHVVYALIRPQSFYRLGLWGIAGAVLVPMIASALAARCMWGNKP